MNSKEVGSSPDTRNSLPPKQRIIVAGNSTLGANIASALVAAGADVALISSSVKQAQVPGVRIIHGDEEIPQDLDNAGIHDAISLVLAEDDDLSNLRAALLARTLNPKIRIILRLFNVSLATRKKLLPRCEVISASLLAAPVLAAMALDDSSLPSLAATPLWKTRLGDIRRVFMAIIDRRFALISSLIALSVLIATGIFHSSLGWSWTDSLYFATATLTTVGYGDLNLAAKTDAIKLFDVGFMLAGWLAMGVLLAVITDAVVGERLSRVLGTPPPNLKGHILIAGLGNIGYRVAQELNNLGYLVVCIDNHPNNRFLAPARREGIIVVVGDASNIENLILASASKAQAVLALTNNDLVNLEVSLSIHDINPKARIVTRLADPHLAQNAEGQLRIPHTFDLKSIVVPAFVKAAFHR